MEATRIRSAGSLARHIGQQTSFPESFPNCVQLGWMFDLIHFSQKVCKHGKAFGSVKISVQIEQTISSCITFHSSVSDSVTLTKDSAASAESY